MTDNRECPDCESPYHGRPCPRRTLDNRQRALHLIMIIQRGPHQGIVRETIAALDAAEARGYQRGQEDLRQTLDLLRARQEQKP